MALQRPGITPGLPQWDLIIVLEASPKHITLKTVFLIAMASAGRSSELQALVFDPKYIQFKSKPVFKRKNKRPNQVNDPWYIPAVPTGKSEFGAPNCPVRSLRYFHRFYI